MNCWIVTWDGTEDGLDRRRIISAFNYRLTPKSVSIVVEKLYTALCSYSDEEHILIAKSARNNPYPAKIDMFARITCGHNPWLYARFVRDLRQVDGRYEWVEPDIEAMKIRQVSFGL